MCFRPTGLIKNKKCPKCGTINNPTAKKCKSCDTDLDEPKK